MQQSAITCAGNRPPALVLWLCLLGLFALRFTSVADVVSDSDTLSIAELETRLAQQSRVVESFRIEGAVCAIVQDRKMLAIQDSSATALIAVPVLETNISVGDWVEVTANHCALTRSRFGIEFGTTPLINNDGHHPEISKTGTVYLDVGLQPIRATWFNGRGLSALKIEYQGPGIPRQPIPSAALFRGRSESVSDAPEPGLDFAAYTGADWLSTVPDFEKLTPVSRGTATNFDLHYAVREENAGLSFSGFIEIPVAGLYTFFLSSDDGGYLYAGNPAAACRVSVLARKAFPAPQPLQNAAMAANFHAWAALEGEVTFASQVEDGVELELEVAGKGEPIQAEIFGPTRLLPANLLHQRVQLTGIIEKLPAPDGTEQARLIVPGIDQLTLGFQSNMLSLSHGSNGTLIAANEIRNLTPEESRRRLPAHLMGVVTWCSPSALVLQDHTGGVYIEYFSDEWTGQPAVGDFWEVEGVTDPGQFSPILNSTRARYLGHGVLPEPIRPTWNQLLNGSLDAEYVELRGVLVEISSWEMTLLTPDGTVQIQSSDDHPLPYLPRDAPPESYLNSIVRIRGCLTAQWDAQTRQVVSRAVLISPGSVEVEEYAPRDPFNVPVKRVADLLFFDSKAAGLQRIKVKGQINLARRGMYCLQDGTAGLRLRAKEALTLQPGDVVEAVGFLQLGGPSPTLLEPLVRTKGASPLPPPVTIAGAELLNPTHDATRVSVEAILLEERTELGERILELQAGNTHFTARMKWLDSKPRLLATGSHLRLTGVYLSAGDRQSSGNLDAFELDLNGAADIQVLQQPPWWTQRRALALVGLLAGILIIALLWIKLLRRTIEERTTQLQREIEERQRMEQRRLMEEERTRVAQDLHDELGAGLTEMGLLGDLVKRPDLPPQEKQQYLGQLTNTARSMVASLDEIVWAVNPRYDSVADLASYYALFAQRFLDLAGVACRLHLPTNFPQYPLDAKERHSLFLAFKEALNNVVRHSEAAEVCLKIEVSHGELVILIADNGRGFDISAGPPSGDGFEGMRRRLEQMGGSCDVRSKPAAGTEVELRLPV